MTVRAQPYWWVMYEPLREPKLSDECEHEYSRAVYDGITRPQYRVCNNCGHEAELED